MRYSFCPHCGEKAGIKEIGDEGKMSFCFRCNIPLWDMFSTCIIAAVVNEYCEVALLRQSYVSEKQYVCVAGFMKLGESAEDTAIREIREEIGLNVCSLQYVQSYPYEQKNLLMLGFKATVNKSAFTISKEVEAVEWFAFEDALAHLREGSIAWQLVKQVIESSDAS